MFDMEIIPIAAEECRFEIVSRSDSRIDIRVGPSHVLCFKNMPEDDDTIVFFENGWHSHGDILGEMLGCEIEDVPEEILAALRNGKAVLVRYSYADGRIELELEFTKWLSVDFIKELQEGESVEYSRAV